MKNRKQNDEKVSFVILLKKSMSDHERRMALERVKETPGVAKVIVDEQINQIAVVLDNEQFLDDSMRFTRIRDAMFIQPVTLRWTKFRGLVVNSIVEALYQKQERQSDNNIFWVSEVLRKASVIYGLSIAQNLRLAATINKKLIAMSHAGPQIEVHKPTNMGTTAVYWKYGNSGLAFRFDYEYPAYRHFY